MEQKTFHLAITMAGAISAGAYTAGVMDYLIQALDNWTKLKKEADEFFEDHPFLKNHTFEEFKNTPEFAELPQDSDFQENFSRKLRRYKAVPDHDVKIEILSGASAGGMTAAISSMMLQLENKFPVEFLPDETDNEVLRKIETNKQNNRLYNSWVNLTSDDMLSVLLGDEDIKIAKKPVSVFNSKFIRDVADRALRIDVTDKINPAGYVSDDFNLFVTLTNLEGYQKSLNIDRGGQRADLADYGEFITYNHSDLVMFSFGGNSNDGTVQINFNHPGDPRNKRNIKLLGDAAVATGAFPIGLEYASFEREPSFINDNYLISRIHSDTRNLVEKDKPYGTTFIDGGLINNEPFELTDCLLKERLKQKLKRSQKPEIKAELAAKRKAIETEIRLEYENKISDEELETKTNENFEKWLETEVRKAKNYTILMIDPFPSERKTKKDFDGKRYPYDLFGVIAQLVATMRSQLLVKTNLFTTARDENDFSCYLIAPRRRRFQMIDKERVARSADGRPLPVYEKDKYDEDVLDSQTGKPVVKIYDGSAAIACGVLGGFGGFLDKSFREHDFYLGRLNCKSFLRKHFRIKSDGEDSVDNTVTRAYSSDAKEIFQKECQNGYVPIIPEMDLLIEQTLLSNETLPQSPDELYWKLKYPKYDMKIFNAAKRKFLARIENLIDSAIATNKIGRMPRFYIKTGYRFSKKQLFAKISDYVREQLKTWELIGKK